MARQPLESYVPTALRNLSDPRHELPRVAKDARLTAAIEAAVSRVPTRHHLHLGDARVADFLEPGSVHLVVTSPPYWTLKEYRRSQGQLGWIGDYGEFLQQLDCIWRNCFEALVPGGRLICVVGDVCLSRKKNNGRHSVIPLHASIQERCTKIGFDNLAPIFWNKIANASYEIENGGAGFLGKPYEPNAVIKNDIEFILMERKPGGYRKPTLAARTLSLISAENHHQWFRQIWNDISGARMQNHPAPYPVKLAERLIRMFSFVGDTVLDPFMGTGSTQIAAAQCGRNSIGIEVDPVYFKAAHARFQHEAESLFDHTQIHVHGELSVEKPVEPSDSQSLLSR